MALLNSFARNYSWAPFTIGQLGRESDSAAVQLQVMPLLIARASETTAKPANKYTGCTRADAAALSAVGWAFAPVSNACAESGHEYPYEIWETGTLTCRCEAHARVTDIPNTIVVFEQAASNDEEAFHGVDQCLTDGRAAPERSDTELTTGNREVECLALLIGESDVDHGGKTRKLRARDAVGPRFTRERFDVG